MKFGVILADPPWSYSHKTPVGSMGGCTYPTMSAGELASLPIERIAKPDCALFMWATFPKLWEAMVLMDAWGFTYRTTCFVWVKTNRKSEGIYSGMGRWTNGNAEVVLFGRRGRPIRKNKDVKQIVMAPRGIHSAKPPEVHGRIERLIVDSDRLELFARVRRPGWTCLGRDLSGNSIADDLANLETVHQNRDVAA